MSSSDEPDGIEILRQCGVLDPTLPTTRIVTHGAVICLNGDRAWKFKRAVRLRFFDFSTPQRRRTALDAELRLNRRFAPNIYRAVHAIHRTPSGSVSFDGPGDVVDHVLEMSRFADDALLVGRAVPGNLPDSLLGELAATIVDLHQTSEISADPHGAARLQEVIDGNLKSMLAFPQIVDPAAAQELTSRLTDMVTTHADLLDARARDGRVRRGHGDLHLGNIAVVDGAPIPFDCLEFDEEMATTDVLYDVGFLVMDLWSRGLRHEANVVSNIYLDLSPDDENGFVLMPVILAVRATVRAHVNAAAGDAVQAQRYLDLAREFTRPTSHRLLAIGGGSGTGKSTLARAVGGDLDPAPGARILRSDVLRKRLAGVRMTEKLPPTAYTPQARAAVYDEMERLARIDLAGGMSVIVDAVFGLAEQQRSAADLAVAAGVGFTGIWLELPEQERISRIDHRGPDASDADATVARRQTQTLAPPDENWVRLNAHRETEYLREMCVGAPGRPSRK